MTTTTTPIVPGWLTRLAAAGLVAGPLLMLAGHLLTPPHDSDTASELASVAAHPGAYLAAALAGLAGVAAFIPGLLALALLVGDRRGGRIGVILTGLGLVGFAALLGTGIVTLAMPDGDPRQMAALVDAYEGGAAFNVVIALFVLGFNLGLIVCAVALWRRRAVPVWAAAAVPLAVVLFATDLGYAVTAVGFVALAVGLGAAALRLRDGAATAAPAAATA